MGHVNARTVELDTPTVSADGVGRTTQSGDIRLFKLEWQVQVFKLEWKVQVQYDQWLPKITQLMAISSLGCNNDDAESIYTQSRQTVDDADGFGARARYK